MAALRGALTDAQKRELDQKLGTAETGDALSTGLTDLADFAEALLKSPDAGQQARLQGVKVDAAWVLRVREASGTVSSAGGGRVAKEQVDETALNEQDGRVLFFLERIHKPLIEERRHDKSFSLPRLPNIGWIFDTARRAKPAPPAAPAK